MIPSYSLLMYTAVKSQILTILLRHNSEELTTQLNKLPVLSATVRSYGLYKQLHLT